MLAVSSTDSTKRVLDDADSEGAFELQLDPGSWVLRAFRDLDRSKSWQPELERSSEPMPMKIEGAADIVDVKLVLRPKTGGP